MAKGLPRVALCIRKASSWAKQQPYHRVDRPAVFDPKRTRKDLTTVAPGLVEMFDTIANIDKVNSETFKQFIFTDVASSGKFIAGAFEAMGYHLVMNPEDVEDMRKTPYKNVALITSSTFADKPQGVKVRKRLLDIFNDRNENVNGKLIRFIILDSGFKEGIDLYDVKYVHLLEPLLTKADQSQAIGRATRYCGQMGLRFQTDVGWPLHVYRYEAFVSEEHLLEFGMTLFDFFVKASGIDPSKIYLSNEIDTALISGAVDRLLTRNLHEHIEIESRFDSLTPLQNQIAHQYRSWVWDKPVIKNRCSRTSSDSESSGGAGSNQMKPNIVHFHHTQNFIRTYFTPSSPLKGMLLYHSVGTGKTCTAVATASAFESAGYSVLWVTRHTLRSEVWKNVFAQVCHLDLQQKITNGELPTIPTKTSERLQLLNHHWFEPLSYKQFGNMLEKNNRFYQKVVDRNGEADPLKKTLLVIDEAHKLFTKDLKTTERADPKLLLQWIRNSYDVSGDDSVRVLLMTATPITEDPMSVIRMLNFLKPSSANLPETAGDFKDRYMNAKYKFTAMGIKQFQQAIDGHISYVNRMYDASQYAIPKIIDVPYMMSSTKGPSKLQIQNEIKDIRAKLKTYTKTAMEEITDMFDTTIDMLEEEYEKKMQQCKKRSTATKRKDCEKQAKSELQKEKQEAREARDNAKIAMQKDKEQLQSDLEQKKKALAKYMKTKLDEEDKELQREIKETIKELKEEISAIKLRKKEAVNQVMMEKLDVEYMMDQARKEGDGAANIKKLKNEKVQLQGAKVDLQKDFDKQIANRTKELEKEKARLQDIVDKQKPLVDDSLTQSVAVEKCIQVKAKTAASKKSQKASSLGSRS